MQPLPLNPICPYCWTTLTAAGNEPTSRTLEHLVPNTILTSPRTRRNADFFACKRCNSRKSHIDYILGVVAKAQSSNERLASDALLSAVNNDHGRAQRFIQMAAEAIETPDGGAVAIVPIVGEELLEYIGFLGRGQYFRKRGRPFNQDTQVMIVDYINKHVLSAIKVEYGQVHGTNPFQDLQENPYAETYSGGDCIIFGKNDNFMFLFHHYTAILIKVRRRSAKNVERSRSSAEELLKHFPFRRPSAA